MFRCPYWCKIKTAFDDEHGLYGAKRIAASLNDDTDFGPINHKKVARIMKSMGLKGFTKRRRCVTTRRTTGHGPGPRKVDTSGVSYAALVSVADVSASKVSGATRLHQECRLRVL
ncbi:transposase [Corynebacterium striatum]|uniref:transposase n=1 Tax=Corynebacterium striatum TaxID=43770 RepID=UPI003B5A1435